MEMRLVLTGEVGAGKSTALAAFADLGWPVSSADATVHSLWREPELQRRAAELWGDDVFEVGRLNRALLAQRAFADDENRRRLNELIHPLVRRATERWLEDKPIAVVEIPLAFEAGLPLWCQGVVYLGADAALRRSRNSNRMTAEDITRREQGFLPSELRRCRSDWFYENNGTKEELLAFVASVDEEASFYAARGLRLCGGRPVLSAAGEGEAAEGASVSLCRAAMIGQIKER